MGAAAVSGGQRQRLCIARTIALGPEVILLDEPLAPQEFALLSLLARRHGEVLSRLVIAEQVWDSSRGHSPV